MLWSPLQHAPYPHPTPSCTVPPASSVSLPLPRYLGSAPFPQPRDLIGSFPPLSPFPSSSAYLRPQVLIQRSPNPGLPPDPAPRAPDCPGVPRPARDRPRTSPHSACPPPSRLRLRLRLQPRTSPARPPLERPALPGGRRRPRTRPGTPPRARTRPRLPDPAPGPRRAGGRAAGGGRARPHEGSRRKRQRRAARRPSLPPWAGGDREEAARRRRKAGRAGRALGAEAPGLCGGEARGRVPAPGGRHAMEERFLSAQSRPQAFLRGMPPDSP